MSDVKPWWQSRTIIGVAVMLLSQLLKRWHVDILDAELTEILTTGLDAVGAFLAIYGRINARKALKMTVPGGAFNPRAEVRRAKRAERGSADWQALFVVAMVFLFLGVMAFLSRGQAQDKTDGSARVEEVGPEVRPYQAREWLVYVPVKDERPFLTRLFSSLRAVPTFVIVQTQDGRFEGRISGIELTGRAEW